MERSVYIWPFQVKACSAVLLASVRVMVISSLASVLGCRYAGSMGSWPTFRTNLLWSRDSKLLGKVPS